MSHYFKSINTNQAFFFCDFQVSFACYFNLVKLIESFSELCGLDLVEVLHVKHDVGVDVNTVVDVDDTDHNAVTARCREKLGEYLRLRCHL